MSGYPIVIPAVAGLGGRAVLSRDPASWRISGALLGGAAIASALLMSRNPWDYPASLGPFQDFFGFIPAVPAFAGAGYLLGWSAGSADPAWLRLVSVLCALATALPFLAILLFFLLYRE